MIGSVSGAASQKMGMMGEKTKVSSVCPEEHLKDSKNGACTESGTGSNCKPSAGDKIKGTTLPDKKGKRDEAHEALAEKPYNVEDFYWETGYWQALAKNEIFGHITLGVISFNAVWIGIDSDHNDAETLADADIGFQIGEQFFCVFFSFEWLTRFMSFQSKRNCLKDGWFKFDSALVFLMVGETWVIPLLTTGGGGGMGDVSILRLLRLLRLTRMARLMRSVPELVTLLKGMATAARSVFSTLVLLILFTYVFAIIFKQQGGENENLKVYFRTIPEAMWNLLLVGTLLDNITLVLNILREESVMLCGAMLFWVLLSSFTILNMLIGVLCEVVSAVAAAEKENNVVNYVKDTLLSVLHTFDADGNEKICEDEFAEFVSHPDTKAPLESIEVDVENLKLLTDVIFAREEDKKTDKNPRNQFGDEPTSGSSTGRSSLQSAKVELPPRELEFAEVLELILQLRSTNPAMVKDTVDFSKHIRRIHKTNKWCFQELAEESRRLQQSHSDLIDDAEQLARRNEEIISTMLVPIASGIQNIQKQLGMESSNDLTVLASGKTSQENFECRGESPCESVS